MLYTCCPQYTSPISCNAPFCNRNVHMCAHFCYKLVHCGISVWYILGIVSTIKCTCLSNFDILCMISDNRSTHEDTVEPCFQPNVTTHHRAMDSTTHVTNGVHSVTKGVHQNGAHKNGTLQNGTHQNGTSFLNGSPHKKVCYHDSDKTLVTNGTQNGAALKDDEAFLRDLFELLVEKGMRDLKDAKWWVIQSNSTCHTGFYPGTRSPSCLSWEPSPR